MTLKCKEMFELPASPDNLVGTLRVAAALAGPQRRWCRYRSAQEWMVPAPLRLLIRLLAQISGFRRCKGQKNFHVRIKYLHFQGLDDKNASVFLQFSGLVCSLSPPVVKSEQQTLS